MAYITDGVGQGGKNILSDIKIIQWMLIRAQANYQTVLFDACYNVQETGMFDAATGSAIKSFIKYRQKAGNADNSSLLSELSESLNQNSQRIEQLFAKSVIAPDDADYKYLLKCTLKPVCVTPDGTARVGFDTDSLVMQALAGRLNFQAFKHAVIIKDGDDCGTANSDGANASQYYTIDKDIILEAEAIVVLNKIGPLYFKKDGKKFNVNSGTRNSYRQADAMYNVYINGDTTLHLYRNRTVVNELLAIINNGRRNGESKTTIIQKMTDVIQKYFEQGILLSGHQKAGAIDIDINGDVGIDAMSDSDIKTMMEIAFKVTGFKALLEKSPPHLHLKFK